MRSLKTLTCAKSIVVRKYSMFYVSKDKYLQILVIPQFLDTLSHVHSTTEKKFVR